MADIEGNVGWPVYNQSNIGHQYLKLATRPAGVVECGDRYREEWDGEETRITREFLVPFSVRKAFLDWVLGYSYSQTRRVDDNDPNSPFDLTKPGILRRVIPDQHPEFPWLYAHSASLVGGEGAYVNRDMILYDDLGSPITVDHQVAVPNDLFQIDQAPVGVEEQTAIINVMTFADKRGDKFFDGMGRYLVVYRSLPYDVRTDEENAVLGQGELSRYVDRAFDYSIRSIPIPKNQLIFTEAPYIGQPVPENGVRLFPTRQLTYTWHELPDLPIAAFSTCVGRVNGEVFDAKWPPLKAEGGFAIGTLLCLAPKVRRYRGLTGRICWTVTYRFDFNPFTWNKFPAFDGSFYTVRHRDGTAPVYDSANFSDLFRLPPPVQYQ